MDSQSPPTIVKVPAQRHRPRLDWPDETKRDGNTLIQALACAAIDSIPEKEGELSLSAEPSTKSTDTQQAICTVIHVKGSDALQLPECLQSLHWAVNRRPYPVLGRDFDEWGLKLACEQSHSIMPDMIQQQLETEDKHVAAMTYHRLASGKPVYCDIALFSGRKFFSFVEFGNPLSASHACWDQFPFRVTFADKERELLINLDGKASQRILNQCILKAQYIWAKSKKNVLVALAVPPTRLHYLLIDFEARTVKVFENAVTLKSERSSIAITGGLSPQYAAEQLVNPEAWKTYCKAALWFHFVAMAFNFPAKIQKAVDADAMRESKRLPPALPQRLQDACNLLANVPPPSLWVSLRLQGAWVIHRSMAWLVSIIIRLWILLTWRTLSTDTLLNMSKYLVIPQTGTLDLRNDSQYRWCPAVLPDCDGKWSYHENKRFYVYPNLKVFVKIFSPTLLKEFETEARIFNRLSEIQGKGIPKLYGSGKIADSDELCLVMSYEGEPVDEWNDEARHHAERLVRLLHEHNVHHHDVALRNVVVDSRRNFTLIDFGLSKEGCQDKRCTEEKDFGIDKNETDGFL